MTDQAHPDREPHDDPSAMPVVIAGVCGTLVIVALVIALAALTYRAENRLEREMVYGAPSIDVDQLHAQQQADLSTPRWIDKQHGIVSIPIDQAIRLVTRELAASDDGTGAWSPRPKAVGETPATRPAEQSTQQRADDAPE